MKSAVSGREYRWALIGPLALLAALVAVDAALGPDIATSSTFAIAAVVAGAFSTVRQTAFMAVLAVVLSVLSGWWNTNFGTPDWGIRIGLGLALGAVAVVTAYIRVRREKALRHMTLVAETAQRALLRSLPTSVGSLGLAARYVSATEEALVGGDLYEVSETPHGVRVIVGDVRGKGMEAVQMAAAVLAGFRRASFTEAILTDVATELDHVVSVVAGDEDFVTAIICEFHDDHSVALANCGHWAPLMVGVDASDPVDTGEPTPPLGLGSKPDLVLAAWPADTRLLLFTDGLPESRSTRGQFFPMQQCGDILRGGSLEEALDSLITRLKGHAGHRLTDDLALILAEQRTP